MKKGRKRDKKLPEKLKALEELINNMTIPEKRFFTIYLARINTDKKTTGTVIFSCEDFCRIMEIEEERENTEYLQKVVSMLLNKIVEIPEEDNYNRIAHLISECVIYKDPNDKIMFEFSTNNNILRLLEVFSEHCFRNHIWNYFFLKSENQRRMYKIMRRYFNVGVLEIDVAELKHLLGVGRDEYRRFDSFRNRVLDACQKALTENTDISYTYKQGKTDKSGKWKSIIFYIEENKQFIGYIR